MQKKNAGLTKRQETTLAFIKKFMLEHQYPPTVREIGEGVGLSSTSSVMVHLQALEDAGKITTAGRNGAPRTITVKGMHYIDEGEDSENGIQTTIFPG